MNLTVKMKLNAEKKHSVRYDADREGLEPSVSVPLTAIYITKAAFLDAGIRSPNYPTHIEVNINVS